jgi:uroporphyrinogen decarboxylase
MKMLTNEHLFIKACRGLITPRTPVWIMRQAGRYLPEYRAIREKVDFLTLCKTPELAAEVTVQPVDIIGVDAAILFSDILVVPEAMGMGLELVESKGPIFSEPLRTAEQIANLVIPEIHDKLSFVIKAIEISKELLHDTVPLIGFSGAPWTLAAYMVEGNGSKNFQNIKNLIYSEPKLAHKLLEKLAVVVTDYLNAKVEAGCDAIQIFDTWGGILTPDDFKEFSLRYIERIIKNVKSRNVPIIVFAKGTGHSLKQVANCGCDVVGLDWTLDIGEARKMVGEKVALQGNLDPCVLFAPEKKIQEETEKILNRFGRGEGHIFNLGHGILPDTPVENVKFFVNTVKELSIKYHSPKEKPAVF